MNDRIETILSQLTLEEKVSLTSGLDMSSTKPLERLDIPSVVLTDGPHGLRKQSTASDHIGMLQSIPATCFPSGAALASSWDRDLIEAVGAALGAECNAEGVAVLLGPAVNIKRSPLCGRNFEYFSEDPFLSSQMAKSYIEGVQSRGVGTSMKHFAANNQENRRMSIDTIVDERTLREIYLASFETAVKEAKPWSVMSAYNKLNGTFCADNSYLLWKVLREEWGHDGFVVSDWGGEDDRVAGIRAGLDLEMPGNGGASDAAIVRAVEAGDLDEGDVDKAVRRVLEFLLKAENRPRTTTYDKQEHDRIARSTAAECIVLLKNDDVLPLRAGKRVAVIGALATSPRYQGGGSSHINPTFLHNAWEEMQTIGGTRYASGYELASHDADDVLEREACDLAKGSEVAVIFAGLPEGDESEGYDRKHLRIPHNQSRLIERVCATGTPVVVVLSNGSAVEMPWIDDVRAVVEGYLGGQAGGPAIVDVLYGAVNPSAKLAETFPARLEDTPAVLFRSEEDTVTYNEGIFVGYRYYDTKKIEPLFPFGHGLSYTTFSYSDMRVDKERMKDTDQVSVVFTVKNIGPLPGKEVAQLYVRDIESTVNRPDKELKGFEKVALEPGEETEVRFTLGKRAFAYYNVRISDWHVESGDFEILVGGSSRDLPLGRVVHVESTVNVPKRYTLNSPLSDLMKHPVAAARLAHIVENVRTMFSSSDMVSFLTPEEMSGVLTLKMLIAFGLGRLAPEQEKQLLQLLDEISS